MKIKLILIYGPLIKLISDTNFIKSVFGWRNLKFWEILNFKNFKYFNWNSFIFKILCLDKKKLKLWGWKKRKNMIGVLVIHVPLHSELTKTSK